MMNDESEVAKGFSIFDFGFSIEDRGGAEDGEGKEVRGEMGSFCWGASS